MLVATLEQERKKIYQIEKITDRQTLTILIKLALEVATLAEFVKGLPEAQPKR